MAKNMVQADAVRPMDERVEALRARIVRLAELPLMQQPGEARKVLEQMLDLMADLAVSVAGRG